MKYVATYQIQCLPVRDLPRTFTETVHKVGTTGNLFKRQVSWIWDCAVYKNWAQGNSLVL